MVESGCETGDGSGEVSVGSCKEGAAVTIGRETNGTPNDGNAERPNVTSRVTDHLLVAPCDNKGVDACNYHKCVAPCDNFVASHDNPGTVTDALRLVAPRDNLGSTYSGRVLFLPFLPKGIVALSNNLFTLCDNEVEQGRGPTPDGGKGTAPKPHAR